MTASKLVESDHLRLINFDDSDIGGGVGLHDPTIVHRSYRQDWQHMQVWSLPCVVVVFGPASREIEVTEDPVTCLICLAWEP